MKRHIDQYLLDWKSNTSRKVLLIRGARQVAYIFQQKENIMPVEIKSGTQGKMQSLRIFLAEKKLNEGIRISLENFCRYDKIRVYPLYAIGNILKD